MSTLLVRNIHTLVTMNAQREELRNAAIFVRDRVIEKVGPTSELPAVADEVLDLHDRHVVLPGLVNTHHHFYQTLTRAVPAAQNCSLFEWLKTLYPIWSRLTAEGVYVSTQMCAAELMLSGCTTSSDHLYLFPNDVTLDEEIRAARDIGIRFHACRGSMSVGESLGGLPPDRLVENEEHILRDSRRVIEQFHDSAPYAMARVALAPCSPFSVSPALMRESAALARSYGVRLHTHLAENQSDVEYSLAQFGLEPGAYAEAAGWVGPDVWHAHCVRLSDSAISLFGQTGTGVAHCPCSNLRLASGLAPVRKMRAAGVPVGLGADGAASNDATHLLGEARQAMLIARVLDSDAAAMTAREALEIATLGGARVLGRDDIGRIEPGAAADFITVDIDRPSFAGAQHDPVAALLLCHVDWVDYSFINGRRIVDQGRLTTVELPALVRRVNRLSAAMVNGM
ncbi:cytosine/adenosine deaminase-related metal-dependent hydrolase [Povalibacter uvarum]|uniref:Cytosine/adenosine deaminase-related metal-dependent hydrolase n=1 Tax=Povalibacter uvarum TaxID=732238 RepID=A0A841HS00_9GAMM|nr:8-oxoguanine deaminase [Povalibacter uvarum]MBB6095543.1 cytosine/adenosine deaminase-related metal-dependent hydrolase [Povalibacter uvarum]